MLRHCEYNQDGIRTKKEVNGIETQYYLENNNIIYESRNNNFLYYLYDLTGVAGLKYNDNVYYYIKNDIIGILNSDYEKVVDYQYDSCGKLLSIKDQNRNIITDTNHIGIVNPFRYKGYYYDNETNLYYLNSRYYNPEWQRFISADEIIGANQDLISYNLYVYVSNNPIMFRDFTGQGIFGSIWKSVKKVVNSILNVNINKTKSQKMKTRVDLGVAKYDSAITKTTTTHVFGNKNNPFSIEINHGSYGVFDSTIGVKYSGNAASSSINFGLFRFNFSYTDSNDLTREFGQEGAFTYAQGIISKGNDEGSTNFYIKESFNTIVLETIAVGVAVFIVDGFSTVIGSASAGTLAGALNVF